MVIYRYVREWNYIEMGSGQSRGHHIRTMQSIDNKSAKCNIKQSCIDIVLLPFHTDSRLNNNMRTLGNIHISPIITVT